jgi:hypothetical protein
MNYLFHDLYLKSFSAGVSKWGSGKSGTEILKIIALYYTTFTLL